MKLRGQLGNVLPLIALGYLGFYVFGLVMGVFTPLQLPIFTAIAGVAVVLVAVRGYRLRRAMARQDDTSHDDVMQEAHKYRERRGW